jgi:hypothetical protein
VRSSLFIVLVHDLYGGIGWDDDCPGLMATLAREEEWKRQEDQNDKEMAHWALETSDGWGGVQIASPVVEEGWPGVRPVDCGRKVLSVQMVGRICCSLHRVVYW